MYLCVIIFLRIPTYSFRRTSVSRPSLCGEESSFSPSRSAGSAAGLHLQKLAEPNIHRDHTMRSGVGLCVLGLLCLHSSVFGQAVDVQPGVLIFCDDPSVEKAVDSALHKFNEKLATGHKLALYQILTASKSENGSDSVYSLQFTSRRSDCPAGSNKPWRDCDYLSTRRKEPISCNATVYLTEAETDTKQVDCELDAYIVPEKASCLGCPEKIDETSEELRVPLSVSISKYNSISDSTHLFTLHTIGHATRQVVAGFRFKVRFDMQKTTCAKAEHKDLNDLCVPDEQDTEFTNCNSTVDVAPWRLEAPEAQLECEPGELPVTFNRRRPPGWSPLRNILYEAIPSKPPTKAKEESSEEDLTAVKPSGSPDVASDAGNDNPFHCPSKPWKPFNPVPPAVLGAPTKASIETGATQLPAEVGFSDKDLLA
ncbi:kininogen-1-like isoform X2 [Seriola lalandi dorsalis]|uniref:kininogen-1-like isoform X2 n=1 Tax=Seriola lalandi dorsalis TaxID=1841481 RepID=UPI000C6FB563|nr:kininogen-1-like isoform X2 [Seriola lalandi dorsalis]XP_056234257.1 kininogen-1 isoform X2 [Seriola aureovittata]